MDAARCADVRRSRSGDHWFVLALQTDDQIVSSAHEGLFGIVAHDHAIGVERSASVFDPGTRHAAVLFSLRQV